MKICPRCKEKKSLDEFYRKKDRAAGSYCKPCQHAYVREHYLKTSAVYNARRYALHLAYTMRNRKLVLDHLAQHPGVDCGESDILVLDFDHVRGTKHGAVSRMIVGGTSAQRLLTAIENASFAAQTAIVARPPSKAEVIAPRSGYIKRPAAMILLPANR